ncbi:hypothetical protein BKA57DRAFT_455119 [Linnemannia elongata]|nr:hypothetical protein BKA57DRAFT_455119 [Linnemannia elongata]
MRKRGGRGTTERYSVCVHPIRCSFACSLSLLNPSLHYYFYFELRSENKPSFRPIDLVHFLLVGCLFTLMMHRFTIGSQKEGK